MNKLNLSQKIRKQKHSEQSLVMQGKLRQKRRGDERKGEERREERRGRKVISSNRYNLVLFDFKSSKKIKI